MNQSAGYVEHEKAASPENQQQQSNHEERSESHIASRVMFVEKCFWKTFADKLD
jgi:hypothetical protein